MPRIDALQAALEEAAFFVSLGQPSQAVQVLHGHIAAAAEVSPLAHLELLQLLRDDADSQALDRQRAAFAALFGFEAPVEQSGSTASGKGLDEHPLALLRVCAAWPGPDVLAVIDDLLFQPPRAARELLSLHAGRELLWLHGLAQQLAVGAQRAAGPRPPDAAGRRSDPVILPWAVHDVGDVSELSLERLRAAGLAGLFPHIAVDVDLSEPETSHA